MADKIKVKDMLETDAMCFLSKTTVHQLWGKKWYGGVYLTIHVTVFNLTVNILFKIFLLRWKLQPYCLYTRWLKVTLNYTGRTRPWNRLIRQRKFIMCMGVCFQKNWLSRDIVRISKLIVVPYSDIYTHWLCSSSKRKKLVMWCILLPGRLCGLPGSGMWCIPSCPTIVICRLGPIVQKLIKIWKAGQLKLQPAYWQSHQHNRSKTTFAGHSIRNWSLRFLHLRTHQRQTLLNILHFRVKTWKVPLTASHDNHLSTSSCTELFAAGT